MLSLLLIITTASLIICQFNATGNEILVLTKNDIDTAVKDNEYIFVKFYTSWCKYSRELSPQYVQAAKKISDLELPVKLAEIEVSNEQKLCEKQNVLGYPSLILFRRGVAVHYYDDRTVDKIVDWIKSQIRPAVRQLRTIQEASRLIETENSVVIGFYNDLSSAEAKNFERIAESFAKPIFAITSTPEIMVEHNATSATVILFEKFNEEKVTFVDELTLPNMQVFLEIESAPLVYELNSENGERVFKGKIKTHLIIFGSKKGKAIEHAIDQANPIAKEYRKKIMFLTIDIDNEQLAPILTYFNINPSETPAIGLLSTEDGVSKYKMKHEITTENIRKFLQDFIEKKLPKILLSEQLPNDWNVGPIRTLVASNFVTVTEDDRKTVVVYVYTTECKACPVWEPIVRHLGEYYESRDDVFVAKINAGVNEFDRAPFHEVPSIVLYKKVTNTAILYKGNPLYEDLIRFIESDGNINVPGGPDNVKQEL